MKNNYNNFNKNLNNDENLKNVAKKDTREYSYYSRVLGKPFDSIEELKEAEAIYFTEQKAKEDKVIAKKADAKKVEDAFKALKDSFEFGKKDIHAKLAAAEDAYKEALKAFTDKYPEGYHLTLKDGDFETTISNTVSTGAKTDSSTFKNIHELFEYLFSF